MAFTAMGRVGLRPTGWVRGVWCPAAGALLLLCGCISPPQARFGEGVGTAVGPGPAPTGVATAISERQTRVVAAAEQMLATQQFVVSGHRYSADCTGTVLAIYAMAGLRLIDLFPQYTGNGVQRLYGIARDRDLLYHSEFPQPADLIFWDNTYDRNGDGLWNDPLTHVGVVVGVQPDGLVTYIHYDYSQGVVLAHMSLTDPETHQGPDGRLVNSPMRMRSHRHINPDAWLASHLYRRLGAMHEIRL